MVIKIIFNSFTKISSFESFSDYDKRFVLTFFCFFKGFYNSLYIMSVNHYYSPSKSFPPVFISIQNLFGVIHNITLSISIAINKCTDIIKFVMRSKIGGFPNRSFLSFSISKYDVVSITNFVKIFRWICHSTSNSKSLS